MALTTDLEGYWNLDNDVLDSADAHDGTNTNCTYVSGKNNNCLQADATGDEKVEFDDIDFIDDISISLWFMPNGFPDTQWIVGDDRWSQSSQWAYNLIISTTATIKASVLDGGGNLVRIESSLVLQTGYWYHIVMTYDGYTLTLYIDGSSEGTDTATTDGFQDCSNVLRMMSVLDANDEIEYPVDGKLDEVGVWKRVLTSSEVTDLYNGGIGVFYDGTSFVEPESEPSDSNISALGGVLLSNVSQVNSILKSNIAKVNSVTN